MPSASLHHSSNFKIRWNGTGTWNATVKDTTFNIDAFEYKIISLHFDWRTFQKDSRSMTILSSPHQADKHACINLTCEWTRCSRDYASKAKLSSRQFHRTFRALIRVFPANIVSRLRRNEAGEVEARSSKAVLLNGSRHTKPEKLVDIGSSGRAAGMDM